MDTLLTHQCIKNIRMLLKDDLLRIIRSQRENLVSHPSGIIRENLHNVRIIENFALVISGIRRCGKSTLLLQSMKTKEHSNYVNFEDPRLKEFEIEDFELLEEVFEQDFGKCDLFYFDEIQNLKGWESYVRYLLERKKNVILTGSNASLLSRELGTKLTGRYLKIELFPFSFREFLIFRDLEESEDSFRDYLVTGGFPEYVKTGIDEILQTLLLDIIARDIVVRHGIRNPKLITEMAVYLLRNVAREYTCSSLTKIFPSLGSVTTAVSYLGYLEDSYILFSLSRFSYSLKSQQINPKKIYAIDNGFLRANSIGFSEDYGRLLENYVFLELRRRYRELFYFREQGECDFLVKDKTVIVSALQVCYHLNSRNQKREINGLLEAMNKCNLDTGYILTFSQEEEITIGNKRIVVRPAWKFDYDAVRVG